MLCGVVVVCDVQCYTTGCSYEIQSNVNNNSELIEINGMLCFLN